MALQAKSDLVTAYNDAAGRGPATLVPVELGDVSRGGLPLTAGVYTSPTFGLTGTLTLDAEGDPDAQFVFQATLSTLITASNSRVLLINDAQACHVVWQVTSSATFGTGTQFVGDVLALTSITATTAATFQGRLLARNGAVTLDTNTITRSTCASTTGGTSSTSTTTGGTATTSPSATPGPTSGGGGTAPAGGSPAGAPGSPGATPGGPSGGDSSTASSRPSLPVTGTPDAELTALGLALLTLGILMLGAERRARTA